MRIISAEDVPAREVSGHRTGDIRFQRLLQGDPDRQDNYEFSLVRNGAPYYTPRHRHNFDQVRMILEGEFSWASRRTMATGTVGYFPEGTHYGPQNVADCLTLILQCGAPSGHGFLSYDQLHQGHVELAKLGRFEDGIFRRDGASNLGPGTRRNQDGYEAIWEHMRGRRLAYPKARYGEPVIMHPDAFDWRPGDTPGHHQKPLGGFAGNVRVALHRLDAGARATIAAERATHLLFFLAGAGLCGGRRYGRWSAAEIDIAERVTIAAEEPSELLAIGMAELGLPAAHSTPAAA